eukprot:jgi/Mesvir1/27505/Mv07272-RA.2
MGKGKGKKKKAGTGAAKTEKKTAKAAEKRARREEKKKKDDEDDIDKILEEIRRKEAKKVEVVVEDNVAAPTPRCNFSITPNPVKDNELIFYGGEYFNGSKTFVYGDLFRFNTTKETWMSVSSPNSPPPRSAHQTVAWKNFLFVFGGEFTSPHQERFYHYKDFWRFDLSTNTWDQLQQKGAPSARSGHRMVVFKNRIYVFGGFYDTLREVKYYNDLFYFDLMDMKWVKVEYKPGALQPPPRSGGLLFADVDMIFLYGGYCKTVDAKTGMDRGVTYTDMWSLDAQKLEWNKVKRSGTAPGPRAGISLFVHKRRAVVFGGVVDNEEKDGEALSSTFYNEMFAFQMDNRRCERAGVPRKTPPQPPPAPRPPTRTAGSERPRGPKTRMPWTPKITMTLVMATTTSMMAMGMRMPWRGKRRWRNQRERRLTTRRTTTGARWPRQWPMRRRRWTWDQPSSRHPRWRRGESAKSLRSMGCSPAAA